MKLRQNYAHQDIRLWDDNFRKKRCSSYYSYHSQNVLNILEWRELNKMNKWFMLVFSEFSERRKSAAKRTSHPIYSGSETSRLQDRSWKGTTLPEYRHSNCAPVPRQGIFPHAKASRLPCSSSAAPCLAAFMKEAPAFCKRVLGKHNTGKHSIGMQLKVITWWYKRM